MFGPSGTSQIDVPITIGAAPDDRVAPAVKEQVRPFTLLKQEDNYLSLVAH